MSRQQESGQVFVLAALMITVLVGVAAFCTNASYMFYQHQRMQAQVDEQTRLQAGEGCPGFNGTFDGGTLVIASTTFFNQSGDYCAGTYTKSARGLFGSLLRFPNDINVHAVAEHGGTTEPYFALLGLSPVGLNSTNCAINFQSAAMTVTVDGPAYSDSTSPYSGCGGSNRDVTFTSPYTYTANAGMVDPFYVSSMPIGGNPPLSCASLTRSGCGIIRSCLSNVPPSVLAGADMYYQADATGVAAVTNLGQNSKKYVYLPYCSGSTIVPTVYLATGSTGVTDNSNSYTYVVSSTVALADQTTLGVHGFLSLDAPAAGPYKGYALYQEYPYPCSATNPYPINMQFNGGSTIVLNGLMDLACSNLTMNGGGNYDLEGSVLAYTIDFSGGSGGNAIFHAPAILPPRGAFLVQ